MMSDSPPGAENVQVRQIQLFENERYSPLSGWSAKGLLPTDRYAITTCDGRDGFPTIADATAAFSSLGWTWIDESWKVDMNLDNVDKDGWTYSSDFTSLKDEFCGSKVKSALHFVRRKRLLRLQHFYVALLAPKADLTCSFCDFEEVEKLSALLLDKLALASALKHPAKNSEAKTVALKNRMMTVLGLDAPDTEKESYQYHIIESLLTTFVNQSKSALSSASSMMASESHEEILRKRTAWLSQSYFTLDEAHEIARLIIRVLDRDNAYHCDQKNCAEECDFFVETCPNMGCGMLYSRKWATKHDWVCPHKILPCERACGDNIKRVKMQEHLTDFCDLRLVKCPCHELGCDTEEITARDLEHHVQSSQTAHLCLIVKRLKEVQGVVSQQQQGLRAVEATTKEQGRALVGLTAAVATAAAALKGSEMRTESNIRDNVKTLETRISKDESQIGANKSDIAAIRAQLAAAKR